MYVDYSYYRDTYGGALPSDGFAKKEMAAAAIVDFYTFDRIKKADDKVKSCVCELIDFNEEQDTLEREGSKAIVSETVSKHKIEYAKTAESERSMTREDKQKAIVRKWLLHTGLMYRGVCYGDK